MGNKEDQQQKSNVGVSNESLCSSIEDECTRTYSTSRHSTEKDANLATCRVCQCAESDRRGEAALGFLDITPPLEGIPKISEGLQSNIKEELKGGGNDVTHLEYTGQDSGFVEFISPDGEVFICKTDIEAGPYHQQDTLIELGCSCKNDLALAHYACALKWFINHGSTVCEICGNVAKNIRPGDFKKIVACLKDYEALRERTATGEPTPANIQTNSSFDPDAIAAVRRLRLSEISLWFNPNINATANSNRSTEFSQVATEQPLNIIMEDVIPAENPATKWVVEGTGIILATGLLTVTLAWLIAPRVGRKTAKSGLHILLGGLCALTVVVFFRFIVLSRIKYGPARYWAILFVFWFLVFGIWASRTHGAHTT